MKKNAVWCFFLLFLLVSSEKVKAQTGFSLTNNQKHVDIPFEYVNNFIILTIQVNHTLPLKFIYDTGAEHTILSKSELSDILRIDYEREFKVIGSDLKTELVAYLARKIHFEINEKAISLKEDILVLQEDYFRFEEFAGIQVHGILSGNIFSKFICKLNYQTQTLSLYDRNYFKGIGEDFSIVPIEVFKNKMYLNTQLQILRDSSIDVKLLLDTGAGLPLLLFTNTNKQLEPPANALPGNIGMGLGGYVEGFYGRINLLKLGDLEQAQVITQFQVLDTLSKADQVSPRNGLIGNTILSRFIIYFDYEKEKIWLKPTKNYKKKFEFDRSGLSFIVSGKNLTTFVVQNITPNSPAAVIDIQKGDILLSIGRINTRLLNLEDILRKLKKKKDKKIRLVFKRNGEKITKNIQLKDLI
jgi:PDZ domain